ncbi:hypothetical protein [Winogradskyella sp. 4-2091]|uniref:hypothetical protein n=1 Tax=Winogradskyella sp. 4-2091 TaxID=3381659 RepID=UPI0038916EF1
MKKLKFIFIALLIVSCSSDGNTSDDSIILSDYIENRIFENGAVIACAGNDVNDANTLEVYFYPENNASNFRLYQTSSTDVDPNDFSNYTQVINSDLPLFNGYLRKFVATYTSERWFVVSVEIDDEIKLSNPIRSKNQSQPMLFSDQININHDESLMPVFNWDINSESNNAIFFQVLSTTDDDLISGTYTYENQFQYYNTSNVVLNITNGTPPNLTQGQDYKFTIMDVSEDNWVNELFVLQFTAQ